MYQDKAPLGQPAHLELAQLVPPGQRSPALLVRPAQARLVTLALLAPPAPPGQRSPAQLVRLAQELLVTLARLAPPALLVALAQLVLREQPSLARPVHQALAQLVQPVQPSPALLARLEQLLLAQLVQPGLP